jgi:hypothetical protein
MSSQGSHSGSYIESWVRKFKSLQLHTQKENLNIGEIGNTIDQSLDDSFEALAAANHSQPNSQPIKGRGWENKREFPCSWKIFYLIIS